MGIVSLRRTRTWARAWQTRSQKRHWQHCLDKPGLHFACGGHTMASLRCCWLAPGAVFRFSLLCRFGLFSRARAQRSAELEQFFEKRKATSRSRRVLAPVSFDSVEHTLMYRNIVRASRNPEPEK